MNSTDDDRLAALMGALFDEVLLPISDRMRAEGVQAFPTKPDVTWLSYYVRRKRSSMTHQDFTSASCSGQAGLERRLARFWHTLGRHELEARSPEFARAAAGARLALADRQQSPELSPYVYAMF